MNILIEKGPRKLPSLDLLQHGFEAPYETFRFLFRNDFLLSEHPGVGDGALDVIGAEPYVEGDRGVQAPEGFRWRRTEPAAPQRLLRLSVSLAHNRAVYRFVSDGSTGNRLGDAFPGVRTAGA